jgi:Eco57I restriction-modification methylase/restriction-modification enzyme MmeI-like protein
MLTDTGIQEHQQWLGYLQPEGLVISAQVLVDNQVYINRNSAPLQARLQKYVVEQEVGNRGENQRIADLETFLTGFLGWPVEMLTGAKGGNEIPDLLRIALPEVGEILEPTFAFQNTNGTGSPWMLLLKEVQAGADLDSKDDSDWSVSHGQRFERLLRDTQVSIGLLTNNEVIRLVYAPRGENSGSLTFSLSDMLEVAGRPIAAAFDELLKSYRLLAAPSNVRLPALLSKSREYQASVSEALAKQVLDSLYELLRGFQAANDRKQGQLLKDVLAVDPDHVYGGLLNVLLRLVFLLFAEDRALLPTTGVYSEFYSVHGLFERLRADNEQFPDTMDARYGAWAQLLAVFRAVYQGCDHPELKMPARKGYLFDPDRFPFLEGRTLAEPRIPLLSDGTVYRVLEKLLILKGQRLSYRTLDVEQIGSVYETIMGFKLEKTTGKTIALKPAKAHGPPVQINLGDLLAVKAEDRLKWIQEKTDNKFTGQLGETIRSAISVDDALAALNKRIDRGATPYPLPEGSMILQPSNERRRSGSHYTPRSLTEPIVRKTLEPVLKKLGKHPTPEQIVDLKIADIAVGSGAFLVEVCRQLGEVLVNAWRIHKCAPPISADEDELLCARRIIAQRCLYAVDRNPMAADLAKLSLWLATLAKDHPFTFLDHSIRSGDSLVGLSKAQIVALDWDLAKGRHRRLGQNIVEERICEAISERKKILEGGDVLSPEQKAISLRAADQAIQGVREAGNLVVAAFFSADSDKARRASLDEIADFLVGAVHKKNVEVVPAVTPSRNKIGAPERDRVPFHWDVEFPEVFARKNGGFDALIGNPPFLGGRRTSTTLGETYSAWLSTYYPESSNNADLVAFFFRRAYALLREGAVFGLIATNTIYQGDTRQTGLMWIRHNEGTIFRAIKRLKWPGEAAVTVSIISVAKKNADGPFDIDGKTVEKITAYLAEKGCDESPKTLRANAGIAFQGLIPLGSGFIFDNENSDQKSQTLAAMRALIEKHPKNAQRIFPYIGGSEILDDPRHAFNRFVIDFGDMSLSEARHWPDLLSTIELRVKPERQKQKRQHLREQWWQFAETRPALRKAIRGLDRVLIHPFTSTHLAFVFMDSRVLIAGPHQVFAISDFNAFCVLQSRIHEIWARFFSSSMEDRLRYAASDCFETFPFPQECAITWSLEQAGQEYYNFRADLLVRNDEGLTKTYNRFQDPEENSRDIQKLRELHAAMDRAVLDAYGWTDIPNQYEFILDHGDERDDEDGHSRKRKKPYRYRLLDEVRDEVLARLLALNGEYAEEERLVGLASAKRPTIKPSKARKTRVAAGQVDFV